MTRVTLKRPAMIAAALACLALAAGLAIVAADVARWQDALPAGDVRYRVEPDDAGPMDAVDDRSGRLEPSAARGCRRHRAPAAPSAPSASLGSTTGRSRTRTSPFFATKRRRVSKPLRRDDHARTRRSRAAGLLGVLGLARLATETQDPAAAVEAAVLNLTARARARPRERRGQVQPRARSAAGSRRADHRGGRRSRPVARRERRRGRGRGRSWLRVLMTLTFLTPVGALLMVALVVPLLALLLVRRRARRVRGALGVSEPSLRGPAIWLLSLLVASALVGLAAAQPVLQQTTTLPVRTDAEVWFVLDVSRSMLAQADPGSPARFDRAKAAARTFRASLSRMPVGIASMTTRVLPHLFPGANEDVFQTTLDRSLGIERPPPPSGLATVATDLELARDDPRSAVLLTRRRRKGSSSSSLTARAPRSRTHASGRSTVNRLRSA